MNGSHNFRCRSAREGDHLIAARPSVCSAAAVDPRRSLHTMFGNLMNKGKEAVEAASKAAEAASKKVEKGIMSASTEAEISLVQHQIDNVRAFLI